MTAQPSICFVIPYFGRWPFWMPFFLESCRRNPDVDWLLFSDCGVPADLPENVRVESISYADYCALVAQRLNIPFAPENAYKLCDIKPALGFIHADRLAGYDFWAFGDIDLVFGRLRDYFTAERLARRDLFSTHERRVSGHLCLMRNTQRMREAFMRMPHWQARFCDQQHHALDEGAFSRIFLWRKNFPRPLFKLVGLFNPWRRRSEFREAFSTPSGCIPWTDGGFVFPTRWFWHEGRLSNDLDSGREFPYFHFVVWKRDAWPALELPSAEAVERLAREPVWQISAQGFQQGES
ncbi:hypothetical protein I0D00_09955 [Pseudomonas lalucatii]|uniref:Glycosyl transferase n=1 Tax=Pseudomonas lalucatii TaxID=1424203 RepID=A0ABS5Q0F7_9PSED|nr:DUF6625 family protein [Pseudomonas lalucatii]MBS7662258.1 hypothetical protein [Pseudomonas lalucatii]